MTTEQLLILCGTVLVLLLLAAVLPRLLGMVRYISNNEVGIVEKVWSARGSVKSGLIALNGEAGYQ